MGSESRALRFLTALLTVGLACFPAVAAKKKFKVGFQGSVSSEFTDNLFHLSDDQLDEFDNEQGPGEQYFDMDDPEDIVTRLRLRANLDWRMDKRRDFRVILRGSYYAHARNSVSDYPRMNVELRHDLTSDDRLYGGVDVVLDRFWKNYRVSNTLSFAPASYDQTVIRLGYERRIHKDWSMGSEYRIQNRDYDAPLASRDRDGDYLVVFTTYELAKRVGGATSIHYGDVATPVEVDNGIPEDRSYTEWFAEQSFRFKPAKKTRLELALQFRQRNSATDFSQDLARFDRVDRRSRVSLAAKRELGKRLSLEAHATYTNNDSDRIDPAIQTDEVGYDETSFGIGLRYEL